MPESRVTEERARRVRDVGFEYEACEQETVPSCNLCGSDRLAEASRRDRYGFRAVLRVCTRCGLGFLSPRLTVAAYGDFYERTYRPLVSAFHGRLIDSATVQEEQKVYAAELRDFLAGALPAPPASVLDVGGSTGVVATAVCDAFGAAATVLDPAPDELAVAEASGMETIAGFVEDYDPRGRGWDLVLLCQTIDHLLDVASTLAALRRMLAPGGHVFVDVLDLLFVARRAGAIEEVVKIDHPYYLTRDTALAYFAKTGLEVAAERLSDDGHWGFLLRRGDTLELDPARLERTAAGILDEIWRLRARAR